MLEILALYYLCKKMGEILRAKGWTKPIWMQVLVVVAWFGSMFVGSLGYVVTSRSVTVRPPRRTQDSWSTSSRWPPQASARAFCS